MIVLKKNKNTITQLNNVIQSIHNDIKVLESYMHSEGDSIIIPQFITDYLSGVSDDPLLRLTRLLKSYNKSRENDKH